jgi:hypothetical protein
MAAGRTSVRAALTGLVAISIAVGLVWSAETAAAALRNRPTLSVPRKVTSGQAIKVSYVVSAHPRGGRVVLQRTFGTAQAFKTIYKSRKWHRTVSLTAPPIGAYLFRLEVRNHRGRVVAKSKTHVLYSYDTVALGTIMKRSTRTVSNNGTLFTYVWRTGTCLNYNCNAPWIKVLKRATTTCRSMSLVSLYKPYKNEAGSVATLQLEQATADAQQATVNPDTVTDFDPTLDGSAYLLRVQATPTNQGNGGYFYLNGSASCYGTHG